MRHPIRSILVLSAIAIILAACGTTTTPQPSAPASPAPTEPASTPASTPSEAPSEAPSESPSASPEIAGTITMVDGVAVGGPGGSIADALASGITEPYLVNGVLFNDGSGRLYLASSITDADAPSFGGPMLEVISYPEGGAEWDPTHAADTGLQEANGVLFFEDSQLFGVVEP